MSTPTVTQRVMALLLGLAVAGGGATYLSLRGAQQVASHEGYRLVAYPDPATGGKPWTICRGHTKGVYRGMQATHEQCDRWYAEDLREAEEAVQRLVKAPLRQGQYDAYVSFVFNMGYPKFASSTMLRLVNSGKWKASCNEFPRWKYANKMVLAGIVKRRYEEQTNCLKDGPYVYLPKS